MKIHSVRFRQLAADLVSRWHEILAAAPQLAGPYFRPEFAGVVDAVRGDVEVAVLEDAGRVVGFFPFQRAAWGTAQPVGGCLSDYQGVIAAPQVAWQPAEIMAACRVSAWEFDHQLAWQRQLAPHFAGIATSPVINLSAGYVAWLESRKAERPSVKETLRKRRKLERESNTVVFTWHTADRRAFEQLLAWKSAQYLRTGLADLFRRKWIVMLLERIRTLEGPHLSGVLSTLSVNDKLVAIHLGMLSDGTLHSWFPAYDLEQSRCSPGQILLLNLAEQAAAHGVTRIDLGKGAEDYKLALANELVEIAEGCVDRRPLAAALRRGWTATRDWVKQTPLREPARVPIRWLRRMGEWIGDAALSAKVAVTQTASDKPGRTP